MTLPEKYAFVDIETSGGSTIADRIIEIGIVRVEDNEVVEEYQSLINPGLRISPFIEQITGINQTDLEDAPPFVEIADKVYELLEGCCFVAHNVRFDYGFIKHELKRLNKKFMPAQLCTVKLSRHFFPSEKHHNLDSIIERFQFTCERRHRAFDDAKVLWEFIKILQISFGKDALDEVFKIFLKKPSLPVQIPAEDATSLPESSGVYIFYGDSDTPLYIGKSKNIKERVFSHFSNDIHSTKEMNLSQEVRSIKTQKTAGELGALLLETHLVKKMSPLYNRKLRYAHKLIALISTKTKDGFESVVTQAVQTIDIDMLDSILGIYRSEKNAKESLGQIAKEYYLCEKLLGLQKINSACFSYHLGWCKGACIGKEKVLSYNLRFWTAFANLRIKPWPFKGPILLEEQDEENELYEAHVIDKWCYLGSIKRKGNAVDSEVKQQYTFDIDMYKILASYIRKKKGKVKLVPNKDLIFSHLRQTQAEYL